MAECIRLARNLQSGGNARRLCVPVFYEHTAAQFNILEAKILTCGGRLSAYHRIVMWEREAKAILREAY